MITSYIAPGNPTSDKLTVLKFWANWCAPCKAYKNIVENVADTMSDVDFCEVDVDANPALAQANNVTSIPCTVFLYQGHEVGRLTGLVVETTLQDTIQKIKTQEGLA